MERIVFISFLIVYFLPTIVALLKRRMNTVAIFALNLFLGLSGIGWIVALVWAFSRDAVKVQESIQKKLNK